MTYYNLEGKLFAEPEVGFWYNLNTGRKISKKPPTKSDYILNDNPRIAGTSDMIQQFWQIQNRVTRGYQGLPVYPTIPLSPTMPLPPPVTMPLPTMPLPLPVTMPPPLPPICPLNTAGTTLYYPTSTDVADIPNTQLDQMCEFTLAGLQLKAKVLYVIDGDTIDLAFFIPMTYLNMPRQEIQARPRIVRTVRPAIGFAEDRGFFARMRVRIAEIDAAEKKTNKGQIAKRLLENRINQLNGIVYANFLKFEKYGRLLADLFEDEARTINIKSPLLEFRHPILGNVAVPYYGGTKIPWPATPPRYQLEPEYQ